MIRNERQSLLKIIGNDLLHYGKIPLLLLIAILISAILVVITTYQTRQLTAEREQINLEKNILDTEWRNLILEEHALADHNRVERIASEKLQMKYIDPSQENIVIYQYRLYMDR